MRAVRIVGAPAAGKSTLRRTLAASTGLPHIGIDDERQRLMGPDDLWPADDSPAWRRLRQLVEAGPCIVETSGLSPNDRYVYQGVDLFTILVYADPWTRRRRLLARVRANDPLARTENYVARLWLSEPVGITPDVIWASDASATSDRVHALASRVEAFVAPVAA